MCVCVSVCVCCLVFFPFSLLPGSDPAFHDMNRPILEMGQQGRLMNGNENYLTVVFSCLFFFSLETDTTCVSLDNELLFSVTSGRPSVRKRRVQRIVLDCARRKHVFTCLCGLLLPDLAPFINLWALSD